MMSSTCSKTSLCLLSDGQSVAGQLDTCRICKLCGKCVTAPVTLPCAFVVSVSDKLAPKTLPLSSGTASPAVAPNSSRKRRVRESSMCSGARWVETRQGTAGGLERSGARLKEHQDGASRLDCAARL